MPFESRNFQDIGLDDVRDLVRHSVGEPLLWEAKGPDVRPEHISKVACSFANGVENGYLLLGVVEGGKEGWNFPGREMEGTESQLWISNILVNNLRPCPQFDVVDFDGDVGSGRVIVVEVQPVATPPCIANGTVFERLPGQSLRVSDPMRLAELYQRGQLARDSAIAVANRRAADLLTLDPSWEDEDEVPLQLGLAVATTGTSPDINKVLFTQKFEDDIRASCGAEFAPGEPMPEIIRPETRHGVTQDRQIVNLQDYSTPGQLREWQIEAGWDGCVAVHYLTTLPVYDVSEIVNGSVKRAFAAAGHLIGSLGGYGDAYMTLMIAGGNNLGGELAASLSRGPFSLPVDEVFLASLSRELNRAIGKPDYEESDDPQ